MRNRQPLDTSSDRNFGMPPVTTEERERYTSQMKQMFGDTTLPTVVYKGETIERRAL